MALTLFNDPFMSEMDRAMNRMLTSFGMPTTRGGTTLPGTMDIFRPFTGLTTGTTTNMPMDIIETNNNFELHADTPGMTPEDIKVELHEGVLTVSGGRKMARDDKDAEGKVWRSERSAYNFTRSFTLPDTANTEGICATMDKGVLKVCIPKKEVAKVEPKRITISSGGGGATTTPVEGTTTTTTTAPMEGST